MPYNSGFGQAPAPRPVTPAPVAQPLGNQVNNWVDHSAQQVQGLNPGAGGPIHGQQVPSGQFPLNPAVSAPAPVPGAPVDLSIDPHPLPIPAPGAVVPPAGTDGSSAPGPAPIPPGPTNLHSLKASITPDQISQFQSLDPAGKSQMIQTYLQAHPEYQRYAPFLDHFMNRGQDPRTMGHVARASVYGGGVATPGNVSSTGGFIPPTGT